MAKYRKCPVVIDAVQWFKHGDHPHDNSIFIGDPIDQVLAEGDVVRYYRAPDNDADRECNHCGQIMHKHGWIDTLEGGHTVCPGDWIITGVKGEHYPCKPDVFEQTYELAEDCNG